VVVNGESIHLGPHNYRQKIQGSGLGLP